MVLVFDLTAEGRVIKNLTVVDDATHEAVVNGPLEGWFYTDTGTSGFTAWATSRYSYG